MGAFEDVVEGLSGEGVRQLDRGEELFWVNGLVMRSVRVGGSRGSSMVALLFLKVLRIGMLKYIDHCSKDC